MLAQADDTYECYIVADLLVGKKVPEQKEV